MLVQFYHNADGKTVDMLIDHKIVVEEIAYIPNRLIDQRAIALRTWYRENNVAFDMLGFEEWEIREEILNHINYLNNPIHLIKRLQKRGRTLSFSL